MRRFDDGQRLCLGWNVMGLVCVEGGRWRGRGGIAIVERQESRYYCRFCIHCCSIVVGGVVLFCGCE